MKQMGLWVRWAGVALCALATSLGSMASTPPPVEDFFKPAVLRKVVLSPSGRYLAALHHHKGTDRKVLVVMDLESADRDLKVAAAYSGLDVVNAHWVGDSHLVFGLTDERASVFHRRFESLGLYAVDREGRSKPKELVRRHWEEGNAPSTSGGVHTRRAPALSPDHFFHSVTADGSMRVLVERIQFTGQGEQTGSQLFAVHIESGRAEHVSAGAPPAIFSWAADAQGRARIAAQLEGSRAKIYWRAQADSEWTLLQESDRFLDDEPNTVRGFSLDGRVLMDVRTSAGTRALAAIDPKQPMAEPKVLVSVPGFDFEGALVFDLQQRLVGVQVRSDAWGSSWFDPTMRAIQGKVDALLPNTANVLDCGGCVNPKRVLVRAFGDRLPDTYYLYDVQGDKVESVASSRPWIQPAQMAQRGFERIKARDGLEIPLHITRPNGVKGAAPTIVLVHGGPWVRGGDWSWEAESQFLASRGYLVLEPEFRGSTGYGAKLFKAGLKQWGQAMQDDLVDALQWAVKGGLADPKKVCIAGGSYGGYAALMGLVRQPETFRCAVEWLGVTDIELMYSSSWSDASAEWKRHGMPKLIGDREADKDMLNANSPLKQAARIRQPILMAHGRQDRRVPIAHGQAFFDAVKAHNPNVEFKVYADEGHGFGNPANEIDFWARVEAFLARQLKN